ncbi:glutathione hydrolase 1 proenzyme-like [Ochlerotatus camptorhynchus]|uniref:glutathione hydrolase 1 proenzyme-like n=1 Tax=Ochlerotatus camptorhynchus TaxID=644619 RepID=UPI0031E36658
MILNLNKKKLLLLSTLAAIVIVALVLGLVFGLQSEDAGGKGSRKYLPGGAVVSNGEECAAIGATILRKGGSAVDAAISLMLCEELTSPQSTGIGGGFLATVYNRETGVVESLDAREMAPSAAKEDMFVGNGDAAVEGGLAIATPGVIKGFWELHQRYGKLKWKELFEPVIQLARDGVKVSQFLVSALQSERNRLRTIPSLRELFVNPETEDVWQGGDVLKYTVLGDTFEVIANEGVDSLHGENGTLLPKILEDLKEFGSIITKEDFLNYKPRWLAPASTTLQQGSSVYSMPLPGSGTIAIYMLNLLDGYDDLHPDDSLTWHRVLESFKHAYGLRTRLGDPEFIPEIQELVQNLTSKSYASMVRGKIDSDQTSTDYEYYGAEFAEKEDHGTAHISVLAPNGDAVAMTGTVNTFFGCKRRSPSTGIIFNNIMDDFSTPGVINSFGVPASPANFVSPGKRPMSSMTPTIVVDAKGDVRMIVGGAGGTRITTSTVLLVLQSVFFGRNLESTMSAPRLHHQLAPMAADVEQTFDQSVINGLRERGHEVRLSTGIGTTTAIARERDNSISAAYDPKRGGSWEIIN